jgi:hypothetical protein
MNKRNNIYLVLFGDERYHPDAHLNACQHRFDYLKDARAFAAECVNAAIFKAHFNGADLEYMQEIR